MGTEHDIYRLVRKISGTFEQDNLEMFVGKVISVNNEELTCVVSDITGKAMSTADAIYDSSTGEELTGNTLEFYNNIYGKDTMYYTGVALMSGGSICDGFLIIPKIGSMVTILKTAKQEFEIVKYSEVDTVQIISNGAITTIDATGLVVSTKDAKSLYRFQDNIGDGQPGCYMSVNNNKTIYEQSETKINLTVENGAKIDLNTKVKISNNSTSLKDIISGINTELNNTVTATTALNNATAAAFASGSFPSAATSFAAATVAITTQLTTIASQLAVLNTKISALME